MKLSYILTGLGLLLGASFFDSIRGPLLPVLGQELGLTYEKVSLFLVAGYLSSMLFGRVLIPLVEKHPFRTVASALCVLAPVAVAFAYLVSGLASLLVFGVALAVCSASIGSMANFFVLYGTLPAQRAQFYALLHAMYGVGSQAAPLLVALLLARGWDWRGLIFLGAVPIAALGLWTHFGLSAGALVPQEPNSKPRPFAWFSLQGLLLLSFGLYVAAEVLGSMWMVAYLVEVRGFAVEAAAPFASGFFIVLTLTRFACFALKSERIETYLIPSSLVVGLVFFILGLTGWNWGFALVGLVGPFFPLVLARITRTMPREAPSLTLRVLLTAQGTLAVCHFGMGYLATTVGMARAYQAPVIAYLLAIVTMIAYLANEKKIRV